MENITKTDYSTTEATVLEVIQHINLVAGASTDANEAMKFSQAVLNLANTLNTIDQMDRNKKCQKQDQRITPTPLKVVQRLKAKQKRQGKK